MTDTRQSRFSWGIFGYRGNAAVTLSLDKVPGFWGHRVGGGCLNELHHQYIAVSDDISILKCMLSMEGGSVVEMWGWIVYQGGGIVAWSLVYET